MSRKQPATSKEAGQLKTDESKNRDYQKVISALLLIGKGNYESIAHAANITELNIVSRRLKEMRTLGLLETNDEKTKTTRGREANVHQLTELGKQQKPIVLPPKQLIPSENVVKVREHFRHIKKETTPTKSIQQKLL